MIAATPESLSPLQGWLIACVKAQRIPQRRLAALAGFSEKHVSQMLNGRIGGTLAAWSRLLEAAHVTLLHPGPLAALLAEHVMGPDAIWCGGDEPGPCEWRPDAEVSYDYVGQHTEHVAEVLRDSGLVLVGEKEVS